jgi:hypothetical protein
VFAEEYAFLVAAVALPKVPNVLIKVLAKTE